MSDRIGRVLIFADFELDLEAMELRRGGKVVGMEPQVFELAAFLAENAGRVVSRDDIISAVWRGRLVSDGVVSTRINAVRRAFGDDGKSQRYIKTVHGRGFRFEVQPATLKGPDGGSRLHNFPIRTTTLIGRGRETAMIKDLVLGSDARLVTLTGAGGSGKTRLAQRVATEVAETFDDGVWFVDLAPLRDPELVASTIAQTLGLQEAPGRSALEILKDYLKAKDLLLVLDNFEHLLSAASMVTELLNNCAGLKALVTSRATLRLTGEHDMPVPPLALPNLDHDPGSDDAPQTESEAAQLFEDRARKIRPDIPLTAETRRTIAEICVRLDGLPLAIELAAARVRLLTPAEIQSRLDRRLPILTGGPRDLPARQQTLRDTIEWSFDLLGAEEQWLFVHLAVFSGGFTSEALEAIFTDRVDTELLERLSALIETSLINRQDVGGGSRFFMLETLREFAAEALDKAEDLEELKRRHASYFLTLAEATDAELRGPKQTERLAQLTRELGNIRAALRWAYGSGDDVELGARLAGALWWFFAVRGHFAEGRQWINPAAQAMHKLLPMTRAKVLRTQANFAFLQGDYANACLLSEDARALFEQLDAPEDAAWEQGLLAIALQYKGETLQAHGLLEEGLALARALDDDWLAAWMLRNLGRVAHDHQDDEAAFQFLEESLDLTRRVGDTRGIALSLHYLGVVSLGSRLEQAHEHLTESIELFRQIGDRRGLAWGLHYLAIAALELGDIEAAHQAEVESLKLRKELGDKRGIAECLEGHACRLSATGQAEAAIRLFATSAMLRDAISAPGPPADQLRTKRYLADAESSVERSLAIEAWRVGSTMPVDVAIMKLTDRQT